MVRFLIPALMLSLTACASPTTNATDGIARSTTAFEAAFNSGDAAALAALYTPDAAVMAPNLARIDGRAQIQGLWQNFFDAGITDIDLITDELVTQEANASEVGHFTLKAPDGKGGTATLTGKYIVIWQLGGDGTWRLHRDIWNNNP